jgi:FkbM family methyltransferase
MGDAAAADSMPVRFNGTWMWISRPSWDSCYVVYESHIADAIRANLGPRGVFYDIGAHVGLWSLYASRVVGPEGRVVACEPSDAFDMLAANAGPCRNIECLRVAIGERVGRAQFHGQGAATSGSLVRSVTEINQRYHPGVAITASDVTMETLTVLAGSRRPPTLVKVDVEGYEYQVLSGARDLMRSAFPAWVIEIHPPQLLKSGGSDTACLELLEAEGYAIEIIDRNPNTLYTVVARPRKV